LVSKTIVVEYVGDTEENLLPTSASITTITQERYEERFADIVTNSSSEGTGTQNYLKGLLSILEALIQESWQTK
jgi:hypothetical protein